MEIGLLCLFIRVDQLIKVRLCKTRRNAKQPKCDVIDNLQKVATGRLQQAVAKLHEDRIVNEWLAIFINGWSNFQLAKVANFCFALRRVLCKRSSNVEAHELFYTILSYIYIIL